MIQSNKICPGHATYCHLLFVAANGRERPFITSPLSPLSFHSFTLHPFPSVAKLPLVTIFTIALDSECVFAPKLLIGRTGSVTV